MTYKKVSADGTIEEVPEMTLEEMQKFVGGYIEYAHFSETEEIICNDNGKISNLPKNSKYPEFAGNIIIVKKRGLEHSAHPVVLEKHFKSRVTSDNSFGTVADYGVVDNTMYLIKTGSPEKQNAPAQFVIEWRIGDVKDPTDSAEIGIWVKGNKVMDYDGVFEIPKEAIEMLKQYGLDTTEIEPEKLKGQG